ncbi:MAG: DUF3365 domain-containing protein [Bacteroidales bacterium]|jgi:signal transduction histidine kinase|nr:DUF3365 domain-containing protein [Bacteroidales bacterium]
MRKFFFYILVGWTVLIFGSLLVNLFVFEKNSEDIIQNKSMSFFILMQSIRAWNSSHGRLYVPVTESVRPNPYLSHPLREVVTQENDTLTMINPAYMTRLIAEQTAKDTSNVAKTFRFHITSLHPIRPANKADEWEMQTLERFNHNVDRVFEKSDIDGVPHYRYMAPLVVQPSCLACHGKQGYASGDIRGGLSVSTPVTSSLIAIENPTFQKMIALYMIIFLTGFFTLLYFRRSMLRRQSSMETTTLQLQQANVTKDKLFNIISHDLRTPASNLLFLSDMLINRGADMSEEKKLHYLELINKAANTSNNLLNNLLQWSRTQSNHITVNPVIFNTKTVIAEAMDQTHLQAEKKEVAIVDVSADQCVKADFEMVTTVLRNLVSNAIKFSYPGHSIVIDAVQLPNHLVQLSVADTGTGMTPDIISTLFDVDKNRTTVGTDSEKGTGLGLILCKEFVERNGGHIFVESEFGKGSKFIFTLPHGNILQSNRL